jgi:hypothetical protein
MAPSARNLDREKCVKALNEIAAGVDVDRFPSNAGKLKVEGLIAAVRQVADCNGWTEADDENVFEQAVLAYNETWNTQGAEGAQGAVGSQDPVGERKVQAFQATYNCTVGQWTAVDTGAQAALLDRFEAFALALRLLLEAAGSSITLEWATKDMQHIHIHLYMHLKKAFQKHGRGALSCSVFERISPHLESNRASGKCFMGALRFGHFYVYVNKIGSVLSWADFLPFQNYGVEGWRLANLLRQGKLHRDVYLKWAARVSIGFQRRLGDVKAAERYEKERAAEEAASLAAVGLTASAPEFH